MPRLQRLDPVRNMARFYLIGTQADLFGGVSVLRESGRIGRAGRVKADAHPDTPGAELAAEQITARKRRRGYR